MIDPPNEEDDLIGMVLAGRYQVDELSETDRFGRLYKGTDNQTGAVIGARVTLSKSAHAELNSWLAQALLSRGKELILAVGHVDRERSYVIFAEPALQFLKPPPEEEEGDGEGEQQQDADQKSTGALQAFINFLNGKR